MQNRTVEGSPGSVARLFTTVTVAVMAFSAVLGAAGAVYHNDFLNQLHPYLFL